MIAPNFVLGKYLCFNENIKWNFIAFSTFVMYTDSLVVTGREDEKFEKFESYLYYLCNNFDFLKYTRNKKKSIIVSIT